jgi:hypothetical protein
MPTLIPPKKLSSSELSDGETFRSAFKEAVDYLKNLEDEIRKSLEATKDDLKIHLLISQFDDRIAELRSRLRRLYHFLTYCLLSTGDIPMSEAAADLEKVLADINGLHEDWLKFLAENKLGVTLL